MKKYRALANGNVIHMSDEAAEVLVPSVYERVSDDTPLTSELGSTPTPPVATPVVSNHVPAKGRGTRKKAH